MLVISKPVSSNSIVKLQLLATTKTETDYGYLKQKDFNTIEQLQMYLNSVFGSINLVC